MQINDPEERNFERKITMIAVGISVIAIIIMISIGIHITKYVIKTYNEIIALQEDTEFAFSMIQSKMQDRLEKIPDLVAVTKAAALHSEKVSENLNNSSENLKTAIAVGDIDDISNANKELSKSVNSIVLYIGKNANITANNQFSDLMAEISGCVNRISNARTNYNSIVRKYNTKIKQFPGRIIASMCDFEEIKEFEADSEASKLKLVDWEDESTFKVLESE